MEEPRPQIVAQAINEPKPAGLTEASPPAPQPLATQPKKNLIRVDRPTHPTKQKEESAINLNHHTARCAICRHPERDAIDQAFLHWERSSSIAYDFQLADRRVVYRHARAFGLYRQRASRSRRCLEFLMEQAESVPATADSIVRAVRAHACLGEDGRWIEPTRHVAFSQEIANSAGLVATTARRTVSLALNTATRHETPPVTSREITRHTCREISAVSPAPSTKAPKLLGTLLRVFGRKNPRRKDSAIA